ncbi:MAG: hypothetical protein HY481_02595 [Candidatus Vogelbacteria bacterium]|nr:hypothetical protein [Candidatus Vogelbacteria bacterium]
MSPEDALETKRLEARTAMEGPEWTAKRELETRERQTTAEKTKLEQLLASLDKQKETLELEWIRLDDQRKIIREKLAPILEREKQAEEAEAKLELDEAKTASPKDKQGIERKRQTIQETRQAAEKDKWALQEQVWQIESVLEANTVKYRALLDQEDEAKKQLTVFHV